MKHTQEISIRIIFCGLWVVMNLLMAGMIFAFWHDDPESRLRTVVISVLWFVMYSAVFAHAACAQGKDEHPEHTRRKPPPI
jgi:hypothetical protein